MTGYLQTKEPTALGKSVTITWLNDLKKKGEKFTVLTCYDSSFANLMDRCGVEVLLVGDSLGMVCQGNSSTLPVMLNDVVYHVACVARGNQSALILADMPFGTYGTPSQAYDNAVRLLQAGAHMVKLEGGAWLEETIRSLTDRGIPVCAHLGLTPQYVHQLGGYRVQGKTKESADSLKSCAQTLQVAGAAMLLLEAIPSELGRSITESLKIPTIGIGAGPDCSAQVLVMHDLLDVFPGKKAKFVKNFMEGETSIAGAFSAFVTAVKDGSFPASEHCF